MTLLVTVVFKNRYGLDSSNGRTKRPLLIIGNACCSAPVTDALLYNGLLAPVTNVVLPISSFHIVIHQYPPHVEAPSLLQQTILRGALKIARRRAR